MTFKMVNHRVLLFESAESKYLQINNQSQPPFKTQHRRCCVPPLPTYCKDRLKILLHFALLHFASKVITFCVNKVITFCVKSYYILRYYYILRQKVLHFALLLHFVSVITFCGVTDDYKGPKSNIIRIGSVYFKSLTEILNRRSPKGRKSTNIRTA